MELRSRLSVTVNAHPAVGRLCRTLTLQELSQRLHEFHEIVAPLSTIDDWFRSRKISFKKRGLYT